MAFNTNATTGKNTSGNGIPDNKKATGFLNLYLPNIGGGRRKLGAIPLRSMYKNEADLADWLAADPAGRVAILLSKLEIEYNASTPAESTAFDMSVPAAGEADPV